MKKNRKQLPDPTQRKTKETKRRAVKERAKDERDWVRENAGQYNTKSLFI